MIGHTNYTFMRRIFREFSEAVSGVRGVLLRMNSVFVLEHEPLRGTLNVIN